MKELFYILLFIPFGYEIFKLLNHSYFIHAMGVAKSMKGKTHEEIVAAAVLNRKEFIDQLKFLVLEIISWILCIIGLFTIYWKLFLVTIVFVFVAKRGFKFENKKWFVIFDSLWTAVLYGYIIFDHFFVKA